MMGPQFGVVTNIGREHLEFFHDLVGVAREEGSWPRRFRRTACCF